MLNIFLFTEVGYLLALCYTFWDCSVFQNSVLKYWSGSIPPDRMKGWTFVQDPSLIFFSAQLLVHTIQSVSRVLCATVVTVISIHWSCKWCWKGRVCWRLVAGYWSKHGGWVSTSYWNAFLLKDSFDSGLHTKYSICLQYFPTKKHLVDNLFPGSSWLWCDKYQHEYQSAHIIQRKEAKNV